MKSLEEIKRISQTIPWTLSKHDWSQLWDKIYEDAKMKRDASEVAQMKL